MKIQEENKNGNSESQEFIHYIDNLIEPLHNFYFSLSNTYTSDLKEEYK